MGATLPSILYAFGGSLFNASTPVAFQVIRANGAATAYELVTVYSRTEADAAFAALTGTQTIAGAKTFSGDCIFTNASNPVMIVRGTGGGPSRLVVDSTSSNSASLGFREANAAKWSFGSVSGTFYIYNEVGGAYALQVTSSGSRWLFNGVTDDGSTKAQFGTSLKVSDATRASLTMSSGTRSLLFESYAADINYLTSNGADFGIFAAASKAINFYPNATLAMKLQSSGNVTIGTGTDDTVNKLQVNGGVSIAGTAPASAAATGAVGSIRWDSGFIYVCTAANTWKRVAIATW